jgi:post-segregation antitoxin (ccd killing protein)
MSKVLRSLDINSEILDQARDLNIDASAVAERALFHKIREQRSERERAEMDRRWNEENAEAIASLNAHFEEHGFPFPQYRHY